MHKHKWRLTHTDSYNTPPGTTQIYRKCNCGEIYKEVVEPSDGLIGLDIPIIVKTPCKFFHKWKAVRDYSYFLDTSFGKISIHGVLQRCSYCNNIRISIIK